MTEYPKPTVLIVDDAKENIKVLAGLLADDDIRVVFAVNGRSALEKVEREAIDLILLDVVMPDMDGYEVCRRLKADHRFRDIPVIFVTGRDSGEDEELGLSLGAIDYITKPFRSSVVRIRVQNHLNLRRLQQTLERLATTDPLTGVGNRRHFLDHIRREQQRCEQNGATFTLIMLDLDHFKRINDGFGHDVGDTALMEIAHYCRTDLRPADLLCRYGGEEFVLLLPDTDLHAGKAIAEQLRQGISALEIAATHHVLHLTGSFGVAQIEAGESYSSVLIRADQALYRAKQYGRNRVESDPDENIN